MRTYGSKRDENEAEDALNKTRRTSSHGSGNAASKRAGRRHLKRRARAEGKKATRDEDVG